MLNSRHEQKCYLLPVRSFGCALLVAHGHSACKYPFIAIISKNRSLTFLLF